MAHTYYGGLAKNEHIPSRPKMGQPNYKKCQKTEEVFERYVPVDFRDTYMPALCAQVLCRDLMSDYAE